MRRLHRVLAERQEEAKSELDEAVSRLDALAEGLRAEVERIIVIREKERGDGAGVDGGGTGAD